MPTVRILPPGSVSNFSRNSHGRSFALNGDNGALYPLSLRPVEILSSSAIAKPITFTTVEEILDFSTIFGGTLGVNSVLQIEPLWTFTSSANNKVLKIKIGETTVYSATRTTSVKEAPLIVLANRNSLISQIQPYDGNYVTAGSSSPAIYSIDFSLDNPVQFTGQRENSGDTLTLEYYRILHFIGD